MFAHCLLPALLLLAAGQFNTSGAVPFLQFVVEQVYIIPDGQCYASYHILEICHPPFHEVGLRIEIHDNNKTVIKHLKPRRRVNVNRISPCLGEASVDIKSTCSRLKQDASRESLREDYLPDYFD